MTTDDESARKERARSIREQIRRFKHQRDGGGEGTAGGGTPAVPKSPRDFIHDRMRKLDEDDDDSAPDGGGARVTPHE